jgi:hypothetical protein
MEPRLGADLSEVKVHVGSEDTRAAQSLGARAFTVGSDVHFGSGEYQPGTKEGDRLIAHELTHVVQGQRTGVHRKTDEAGGDGKGHSAEHGAEVSQPHEPAEKEADAVADHVADDLHGDAKKGAGAKDKGAGKDKGKGKDKEKKGAGGKDAHAGGEQDGGAGGHDAAAEHGGEAGKAGAEHGAEHGDKQGAAAGDKHGGAAGGKEGGAAGASAPASAAPKIAAKLTGVGRKIDRKMWLTRAGTPQTGAVAKDNPQGKDDTVKPESLDNPLLHPYFPTFKARVTALGSTGHVTIGDAGGFAQSIWMQICNAVKAAAPSMADKAAYSNFAKGWLDMTSPKFKEAMGQFDKIGAELAKVGSTQFKKANTFGFWSKDEGRALAESCSDLTLETSSVGSLMDGMPTLDGKKAGWDPEIWGALSNAYANAVVPQVVKGKKVNCCVGAGATSGNIWETVESKALEKGLGQVGMTLESATTYFGAAAKSKKDRKSLDLTKNVGGIPGCVYQGKDRAAAAAAAQAHFDKAPDDATPAPPPPHAGH